jgi:hypothetical protein
MLVDTSVLFLNCEFRKVVDLRRTYFANSISFEGSSLIDGINFQDAHIRGSLILGALANSAPKSTINFIQATGAQIDSSLTLANAKIDKTISLSTIRVGGSIDIHRVDAHETQIAASEVHGQLIIVDSMLQSTPEQVDRSGPLYALLNLNFIHASQDVFLNRTQVLGPSQLEGADIGGSLFLAGATLGTMVAPGINIKGVFRTGYNERPTGQQPSKTKWSPDAILDLNNATIGTISTHYSLEYWPRTVILTNFRSSAFDFSLPPAPGQQLETRTGWFKKWLGLQKNFVSQPYNNVRAVLLASGDDETAAAVGYAGRDRELLSSINNVDLINVIYLLLSKFLIGYGYQMWLPIIWTFAFVAVGAVIFHRSSEAQRELLDSSSDAVFYSLDMFLPLLQLRKRHFDIDLGSRVKYYFYLHKVAGWVIGSFIVVGLAGFTK